MPLYGIDISHHQRGIDLGRVKREGFDFVIARVGQGAGGPYGTTRDREWTRHRDEARKHGLILCAYWYIGDGISADRNAELCEQWIGDKSIPVALDCERGSGGIGHYRAVLRAFQRRSMRVPLSYIPPWYWAELGRPSLAGLPPAWPSRWVSGRGYASSLYQGVEDNPDRYWASYGGLSCAVLQFTNSARVAGMSVDANAFRGSRDDLHALLEGDDMPSPKDWTKADWAALKRNIPDQVWDHPIKNVVDVDIAGDHMLARSFLTWGRRDTRGVYDELGSLRKLYDDETKLSALIRENASGATDPQVIEDAFYNALQRVLRDGAADEEAPA